MQGGDDPGASGVEACALDPRCLRLEFLSQIHGVLLFVLDYKHVINIRYACI